MHKNLPYYTPFNFIKQLKSSLHEAINHKVSFASSFNKERQCICLPICMHVQQTGGKKINQTVIFLHRFAYK